MGDERAWLDVVASRQVSDEDVADDDIDASIAQELAELERLLEG